jgi:hypothetical protein
MLQVRATWKLTLPDAVAEMERLQKMAIESRKQTARPAPAPITREARAIIFGRDAAFAATP